MSTSVNTGFKYNDEFFKDEVSSERASAEYRSIWFALNPSTIADKFYENDNTAKLLKSKLYRFGARTILAGWLALTLLAFESLAFDNFEWLIPWKHAAAWCAMGISVSAFSIGYFRFGVKATFQKWLETRMLCELIRQWRWCYFISTIEDITNASGDIEAEQAYIDSRERKFAGFIEEKTANLSLTLFQLIEKNSPMLDTQTETPQLAYKIDYTHNDTIVSLEKDKSTLDLILSAYDELRFGAQTRYTNNQLYNKAGQFASNPCVQNRLFRQLYTILGFALLAGHIAIGILSLETGPLPIWPFYIFVITTGFTILAVKAYEEGVQPEESLGRLRLYYYQIQTWYQTFGNTTSFQTKITTMKEFENTSHREMIAFLEAAQHSKFKL